MAKPSGKKHKNKDSVLVICAHADDHIFGPGGTIAKYAREGKSIHTIIFTYGELSHPMHLTEGIIKARVKEAQDVDKFIGGSGVLFLGLEENNVLEQFKTKKMYPKLKKLISEYNPSRIFTHALDDPHPVHRAVHKCVIETLDKMKNNSEVYMFDVWTLFNFKQRNYVRIVVDISSTFNIKIKALKMFESQGVTLFWILWSIYYRAWLGGRSIGVNFAEVFYKIR